MALALGTIAMSIATAALLVVPAYAQSLESEFGLSSAQVGALTSTFAIVYVCVQIPAGILGTKVGPRRVLVPSFAILGAAFVLAAAAESLPVVLGSRALAGLGAGALIPLASELVRSRDPRRNTRRQGIMGSGWGLGYVIGLTALPLLFWDWRAACAALAAWCALLAVGAALLRPAAPRSSAPLTLRQSAMGLGHANTWLLGMSMFGVAFVNSGVGAWALTFAEQDLGFGEAGASRAASLIGWALIPSAVAGTVFAARYGERALILWTAAALVCAIALLAAPVGGVAATVAFAIVGWCSAFPLGVIFGLVSRLVPTPGGQGQATVVGALNVAAFSANVIAPPLVGFVADQAGGFHLAFLTLLVGPLCAVIGGLGALNPRRSTIRT